MMEANLLATIQIMNIAILVLWPILSLLALFKIRSRYHSSWSQIAWTLIVLVVPILGALAFFIVAPKQQKSEFTP
jgi:cytochrome bd-type quinol oxidase subunit 2